MGYNRTWPMEYRYGNYMIGSINLPNLHLEQTISQLNIFRRLYNHPKHHQLLNNTLATFQLHCGIDGDILTHPQKITYTDSTWIQCLVNSIHTYGITIHLPSPFKVKLQRENDNSIMQLAINAKYNSIELRQINNCRQFLRVLTVSDLVQQDGMTISPQIMNHTPLESTLVWPRIYNPTNIAWKTWDRFILKVINTSTKSLTITHKLRLKQWIIPTNSIHRKFQYYYMPHEKVIIKYTQGKYNYHFAEMCGRYNLSYSPIIIETSTTLPSAATPLTMTKN